MFPIQALPEFFENVQDWQFENEAQRGIPELGLLADGGTQCGYIHA
jgi:hypothetical protein